MGAATFINVHAPTEPATISARALRRRQHLLRRAAINRWFVTTVVFTFSALMLGASGLSIALR